MAITSHLTDLRVIAAGIYISIEVKYIWPKLRLLPGKVQKTDRGDILTVFLLCFDVFVLIIRC